MWRFSSLGILVANSKEFVVSYFFVCWLLYLKIVGYLKVKNFKNLIGLSCSPLCLIFIGCSINQLTFMPLIVAMPKKIE